MSRAPRVLLLSGVFIALVSSAYCDGVLTTEGALFESAPGQGCTAGARLEMGRREFVSGGDLLDVDILRTTAKLGRRVIGPLYGFVEAGWCRAALPRNDGEGGFTWALGVDVAVWEHVLTRSPVLGKTSTLGLSVTASHQSMESNFGDVDFAWDETLVTPMVRFTSNRMGEPHWRPHTPTDVSVFSGVSYSDVDGDFGPSNIKGNRDFGLVVGADLKFLDSWIVEVSGTFFGDSDHTVGAGVRCNL